MIGKNILANFAGQGWVAASGLLFVPIYIRYLGLESYGLVGVFSILVAWTSQFDVGMTPTLNREMARFRAGAHDAQSINNLLRSVEVICLALAMCVLVFVAAGSNYLSTHWVNVGHLRSSEVSEALRIIAIVLALQFIESIYRGGLIGLQKQVQYNSIAALFATVRHLGAWFILSYFSADIGDFFAWQAVVGAIRLATMAVCVHRALPSAPSRPRFSSESLRAVWRFSTGMVGISLLAVLLTQVDKVLLSRMLPLSEFGLYTLVASAAGAVGLAVTPILQAIYPRLVELVTQAKEEQFAKMYHLATQTVVVLSAPIVVILVLYPEGVLYLWTQDEKIARPGAVVLALLGFGTFLNVAMRVPYLCMLAHAWTSLSFRVNLIAVLLVIPALIWLVPRYGAAGAAGVWCILNAGYIVVTIQFMHRRILLDEMSRWYVNDLSAPLMSALFAGGILRFYAPETLVSPWQWAIFLGLTSIVTLGAAIAAAATLRRFAVPFFSRFLFRQR